MSTLSFIYKQLDPSFGQLNEELLDDIDFGNAKSGQTYSDNPKKETGSYHEDDIDEDERGRDIDYTDEEALVKKDELAAEAKKKGITVDELKEQKETEALEKEAKEKGVTVDELIEQKENKALEDEAKKKGITVDELKEQKETAALEKEAKEKGITVDELKEQKEAEEAEKDIFNLDDDADDDANKGELFKLTKDDIDGFEGLELEDDEVITPENLKDVWNRSIEKAKKVFNISEQPQSTQAVISHLEAGGNIMDFYSSPDLREFDRFMMLDDKSIVSETRVASLIKGGLSEDEAIEKVESDITGLTTEELKNEAKTYKERIIPYRNAEMNRISKESIARVNAAKNAEQERIEKENAQIVSMIDKMDSYRGIEIPQKAKDQFKEAVKDGRFRKMLNSNRARADIAAFMELQFGDKIAKASKGSGANDGYNKGLKKGLGKAYDKEEKEKRCFTKRRQARTEKT